MELTPEPAPVPTPRRWTWKRCLRVLLGLAGVILVLTLGACAWGWCRLHASLPVLSGRVPSVGGSASRDRTTRPGAGAPRIPEKALGRAV